MHRIIQRNFVISNQRSKQILREFQFLKLLPKLYNTGPLSTVICSMNNLGFDELLGLVIKYLSYRPRSKKEIENYLSRKTSDQTLVDRVISKLESVKLLDDAAFAKWLVESRSRSRPRGARLLKQELKSKGITVDDEQIKVDEVELAAQALQKKLRLWQNLPFREFRVKAGRFLAYRGFSWSAIETVVKKEYNNINVK